MLVHNNFVVAQTLALMIVVFLGGVGGDIHQPSPLVSLAWTLQCGVPLSH